MLRHRARRVNPRRVSLRGGAVLSI